ncbi:uncharacterized protein LOC115387786 [Salarias fasciatus]|uniref:uncharacterized protein LOC115387786 n=1 Tax=Salarias fasciatus TaxID=181472 RepID=UPI001176626D|nr:uncharacterized protein LOC115387786 [Salarias fasciatus]
MLAFCLNLQVFLCLYWTALTDAEVKGVQWKKSGESVTIQCRSSGKQQQLALKKGLKEEFQLFNTEAASAKEVTAKEYIERLQTHGEFPNKDILIKNLSPNDTGPYWCIYTKVDSHANIETTKGEGSVLLVVTDHAGDKQVAKDEPKACDSSNQDLIMVCVVVIGVVLLLIIMSFLIWIVRKKQSGNGAEKPRRVATNDVYEEMRGTLRP